MHELSIAEALIGQILQVAKENDISKVDEVVLETGSIRQIIPEMMQEAYASVIKETIADGSSLRIVEIPAEAKCRKCGKEFSPELDNYLCPDCNIADVEILKGNDIILRSVISNG